MHCSRCGLHFDANSFVNGSDDVIQPGQTLWVFAVQLGRRGGRAIWSASEAVELMAGPLLIAYEVGCDNSRMSMVEVEQEPQEVLCILTV